MVLTTLVSKREEEHVLRNMHMCLHAYMHAYIHS